MINPFAAKLLSAVAMAGVPAMAQAPASLTSLAE